MTIINLLICYYSIEFYTKSDKWVGILSDYTEIKSRSLEYQ